MSREGALLKNTAVLSFGTVVPKLVNLVTLPILTGFLTKADYGTYDLVVSMVTLLLPLATLQMQAGAFRFLIDARGDGGRQRAIVTNITVVTVALSVVVLVLLFLLLGGELPAETRLLVCGYYFLDILVATLRQVARGLSRNDVYSASVIANSVFEGLAVVGFVMLLSSGLNGALFASLIGQASSLVLLVWGIGFFSYLDLGRLSKSVTKEILAYSWPLIPNSLSSWAISMSDRLVLTLMVGIEASAVYAAASKVPNMLGIFQSAFNLAWQENASLSSGDGDRDAYYTRMFDSVFNLFAGGLALLIAASPFIFALLIQGDYAESYVHMNILFLGALASCIASYLGGVYIAHMRTKEIGVTTMAVAVANLAFEIVLVPFVGIYGASLAYTGSYAALAVYRAVQIRTFQPMTYNVRKIAVVSMALVVMVIVGAVREPVTYVLNIALALVIAVPLNLDTAKAIALKLRGHRK